MPNEWNGLRDFNKIIRRSHPGPTAISVISPSLLLVANSESLQKFSFFTTDNSNDAYEAAKHKQTIQARSGSK